MLMEPQLDIFTHTLFFTVIPLTNTVEGKEKSSCQDQLTTFENLQGIPELEYNAGHGVSTGEGIPLKENNRILLYNYNLRSLISF